MLVSPSGVSPSDVALSMAQPFPVAAPPRRSLCVPPRRPPTLVARMALKAGGDVACCTHHAASHVDSWSQSRLAVSRPAVPPPCTC